MSSSGALTYGCDLCGRDGMSEEALGQHFEQTHINVSSVKCLFCDLEGISPNDMTLHINAVHFDTDSSAPSTADQSENDIHMRLNEHDTRDTSELAQRRPGKRSAESHPDIEGGAMSRKILNDTDVTQCEKSASSANLSSISTSSSRLQLYSRAEQTAAELETQQNSSRPSLGNFDLSSSNGIDGERIDSLTFIDGTLMATVGHSSGGDTEMVHESVASDNIRATNSIIDSRASNSHMGASAVEKKSAINGVVSAVSIANGVGSGDVGDNTGSSYNEHSRITEDCPGDENDEIVAELYQSMCDDFDDASASTACPVCDLEFTDPDQLTYHVERHFTADIDESLRSQASQLEERRRRMEAIHTEDQNVQGTERRNQESIHPRPSASNSTSQNKKSKENCTPKINTIFQPTSRISSQLTNQTKAAQSDVRFGGMSASTNQNVGRNAQSGSSVQNNSTSRSIQGPRTSGDSDIDNLQSCTKGVIASLTRFYERYSVAANVSTHSLCSETDHFSTASQPDRGWGCGYRNLQMLLSCLMRSQMYEPVVFNGRDDIPSVSKIQALIEAAWQSGFDVQGANQMNHSICHSRKWIGATEIVTLLSFLRVRCDLVDFHAPSAPDGTHPNLFRWVKDYFQRRNPGEPGFRPPLHLQHQGHCRLIVGVEEMRVKGGKGGGGGDRLILFDPGCPRFQMQELQKNCTGDIYGTAQKSVGMLRKNLYGLRHKQYQIVAVVGVQQSEVEHEASKVLKSKLVS